MKKIHYRDFEDARKFSHSLKLKNRDEWKDYCKSGNKPDDIPSNANVTYKNKGWNSFGDFFGTNKIANQTTSKNYLSFQKSKEIARQFAKKYKIETWNDWIKAHKEGKIPKNIPLRPDKVFSKRKKK